MRTRTIYKLEFTFDDLLECNLLLKEKFNALPIGRQNEFILKHMNSISNGMNEGTDFSTVMEIITDLLLNEI